MKIRDAVPEDAAVACDVLRGSIAALCVADHRYDSAILARWLANKAFDCECEPRFAVYMLVSKTGPIR
jgi:hypothetical protein